MRALTVFVQEVINTCAFRFPGSSSLSAVCIPARDKIHTYVVINHNHKHGTSFAFDAWTDEGNSQVLKAISDMIPRAEEWDEEALCLALSSMKIISR